MFENEPDKTFPFDQVSDRNTKDALIKVFGLGRGSFYELVNLSIRHPDFDNDYPNAGDEIIRSAKLSRYQAWFLFHLNIYRRGLGIRLGQLKKFLNPESELYFALSKETYLQQFTQEN